MGHFPYNSQMCVHVCVTGDVSWSNSCPLSDDQETEGYVQHAHCLWDLSPLNRDLWCNLRSLFQFEEHSLYTNITTGTALGFTLHICPGCSFSSLIFSCFFFCYSLLGLLQLSQLSVQPMLY